MSLVEEVILNCFDNNWEPTPHDVANEVLDRLAAKGEFGVPPQYNTGQMEIAFQEAHNEACRVMGLGEHA